MLREAKNNVVIEGILSETDIKIGSFLKNKGTAQEHSVNSISGTIKVKVNQTIDGKETPLEIPIHIFAAEKTNKGNPNPAYQSVMDLKDNFKSIAACGSEDEADRIRITGARINMNEYWMDENTLISYPRITASFFRKVKKEEFVEKATFEVEFVVGQKEYEVDAEGVESGRYKIKGIVPKYGGSVDIIPFYAVNNKAIEVMSQYWNEGDTVSAVGKLLFSSKTEIIKQEVDFGEPIEKTRTINVSDLILTGGSQTPLEGDFAYEKSAIDEALVQRKTRLEALKASAMSKRQAAPQTAMKSGFSDLGF